MKVQEPECISGWWCTSDRWMTVQLWHIFLVIWNSDYSPLHNYVKTENFENCSIGMWRNIGDHLSCLLIIIMLSSLRLVETTPMYLLLATIASLCIDPFCPYCLSLVLSFPAPQCSMGTRYVPSKSGTGGDLKRGP